jgi:predicted transcriptional regulator
MELKDFLEQNNWSVRYFAKAACINHQTVVNIINGTLPRLNTAEKIEKITLGKVRLYNIYKKKSKKEPRETLNRRSDQDSRVPI